MILFSFILSLFANHLPVMYVQVPQWADDWAVCAVDIPDAKCHWYVMAPDNTFGEGFDWESAPWFDANGLSDIAPMEAKTVSREVTRARKLGNRYIYIRYIKHHRQREEEGRSKKRKRKKRFL